MKFILEIELPEHRPVTWNTIGDMLDVAADEIAGTHGDRTTVQYGHRGDLVNRLGGAPLFRWEVR